MTDFVDDLTKANAFHKTAKPNSKQYDKIYSYIKDKQTNSNKIRLHRLKYKCRHIRNLKCLMSYQFYNSSNKILKILAYDIKFYLFILMYFI